MLLVCVLLAVVLRVAVIAWQSPELTRDRDAYLGIARGFAKGSGLVDVDRGTPTAFRPPLYVIQLGTLMLALPEGLAVAVANVCWGAAAVWATGKAGHWLGLGRGSWLAALLVAIDPMLLQYSAQPMTEVTCAGLVALLLDWGLRGDCRSGRREYLVGLLFGGLVLCRPAFWPLAGLAFAAWGVCGVMKLPRPALSSFPWRMVVGTLVLVSPWVIRNQLTMGTPIVMTTHGGYTLLLGNNPVFQSEVVDRGFGSEWSKASFDAWQREIEAAMAAEIGAGASEVTRDTWQSRKARQYIASNPSAFVRAAWYRVRSLWSLRPQGDAANGRVAQAVGWFYGVVLISAAVQLAMVLFGWTCGGRGCCRGWSLLILLVLTVQSVHLAYWTNARMRAPLVPVISLFSASAASCLAGRMCAAPRNTPAGTGRTR